MKKVMITFNDEFKDFDLFMNVMELMAYNGYIESIEEVKTQAKNGIKIIAIDEITKEEIQFDSIRQASEVLGVGGLKIRHHLNKNESIDGYYFKRAYEKQLKLK